MSQSKENILKKIRKALSESTPLPFPQSEGSSSLFAPAPAELEMRFAEEFTRLQGKFVFCLDEGEVAASLVSILKSQHLQKVFCDDPALHKYFAIADLRLDPLQDLAGCDVSVTTCEALVARTGSVVLSAAHPSGRTASVYAPVHICIAYTSQLVYDVRDAILAVRENYGPDLPSFLAFASGPSRTADIEKTLVVGVHGPREVYVLLMDDAS